MKWTSAESNTECKSIVELDGVRTMKIETQPIKREVVVGRRGLPGDLEIPNGAGGLVLFAHGSGSSRLSPRNRFVAGELQRASIATLLFDLLDEADVRRLIKAIHVKTARKS
jgi:hypothetical protein